MIGDRQVRNMGTLGGSLANNDPAADYPAAVLGLGATINTNKRKIEADKFFKGLYETALEPGELIISVSFPVPKRAAYMKFKNPASRFALVGVFVADFGGKVRVAVTGAGPCVFRQAEMEKALAAKFAPDAVASIKVKPERPEQRPAREPGVPRAPGDGHGAPRGGGSAQVVPKWFRRWRLPSPRRCSPTATSSAASAGSRPMSPCAQRSSSTRFLPSTQPCSFMPARRSFCCAKAQDGANAAATTARMAWRRFIGRPHRHES